LTGQKKKTIFIVDDDKSILRVLTRILQKKGYNTETAGTGTEALEKAKNQSFDLALIDLMLPDLNGLDLMTELTAMQPKMVKIVISGLPHERNAANSLDRGADAFLTKPVKPETLLSVIEEKLKGKP